MENWNCGLCGYAIALSTNLLIFAMQALAPSILQLLVPALLAASSDIPAFRERFSTGSEAAFLMRGANASGCPAALLAGHGINDVITTSPPSSTS